MHHVDPSGTNAAPVARAEHTNVEHHPFPGTRDAVADDGAIYVLGGEGLIRLSDRKVLLDQSVLASWDTLRRSGSEWSVEGPCPTGLAATRCAAPLVMSPPSVGLARALAEAQAPAEGYGDDLVAEVEEVSRAWNLLRTRGWRIPFRHIALAPGGLPIALARSSGRLMRSGHPPAMAPVPIAASPCTLPTPFVMHPTGMVVYLLSWPGQSLRALDPGTLASVWDLELDGAGQGLFLEAGGRFLLLAEGPDVEDCFSDWPTDRPASSPTDEDPARDERLRVQARPPMSSVVVVDTALHHIAARVSGSFLRFEALPSKGNGQRFLLVTTNEVAIYTPEPLP